MTHAYESGYMGPSFWNLCTPQVLRAATTHLLGALGPARSRAVGTPSNFVVAAVLEKIGYDL